MVTTFTPLTRLFNNCRTHLPGALDTALQMEFFNVLDEFLQKTNFWQEEIDYVTTEDELHYDLVGTEGGQIISLISNVNANGVLVQATMAELGGITLGATPPVGETYTATVAYTVVDPGDVDGYPDYPDDLLEKYGQGIMHGMVGAMMTHAAKPYSNQQMAVYHTRKFAGYVANARAEVAHKNMYSGQRWRFPRFSPGSQR